jgi:hypothetical protein
MGAVGQLFGVPRLTVWWWVKTDQLRPSGTDNGTPWWSEADVYDWALNRTRGDWSGRVPVTAWPAQPRRVVFRDAVELPGAVAHRWHTAYGPVSLVWPLIEEDHLSEGWAQWVRTLSPEGTGAVVEVSSGLSLSHGPEVSAVLPALPDRPPYPLTWTHLSAVLGEPLPYWPPTLRDRRLLAAWNPEAEPTTAMPVPALDTAALLTMASTYPEGSPTARVLVNLARRAHSQAIKSAEQTLQLVEEAGTTDAQLRVAARPLPAPAGDLREVDSTTRRAGWLDVLARTDDLARRCVTEASRWDGGADLPFSNPQQVDPQKNRWAFYWSKRLAATERTAAFEIIGASKPGEAMIDPATDAPVLKHISGRMTAAIPQRLPATSPLAELILADPVWIRTADRTIYPAPRGAYYGLSWGYSGSGPGALALLVDALLDDINAKAPAGIDGAPAGLEELFTRKLPKDTVLTRAQLEAARRGDPVIIAVDTTDDTNDEDEDDE